MGVRHAPSFENSGVELRPRQIELLDVLELYFFEHGYRRVTMAGLAERLHCSKRALYELAPSRRELFVLVVERWVQRIRKLGLAAEARHGDPCAQLRGYLEPGITETQFVTEAFLLDLRQLPEAREVLDRHQRERMETLLKILERGVLDSSFANIHAHLVAGICLAGIEKINEPEFLGQAGLSFSAAFAELYRLLMTGLQGT